MNATGTSFAQADLIIAEYGLNETPKMLYDSSVDRLRDSIAQALDRAFAEGQESVAVFERIEKLRSS